MTDVKTRDGTSQTVAPGIAYERVLIHDPAADGGEPRSATWGIAVETPIEISINGAPWMVVLATPADLEDLAIGLAVTERVLVDTTTLPQVTVSTFLNDVSVRIEVKESHLDRNAMRARATASGTACGMCGLESLAQLHLRAGDIETGLRRTSGGIVAQSITDTAILAAFAALPSYQPINRETHSVHAAAWCNAGGDVVLVREDVGRHNALDKLVGAMVARGLPTEPGFVVMSSRCSFELVAKASSLRASLLATISAPTTMALQWSAALGLPLACRIGGPDDGRIVRFRTEARGAA